jgi:hypothetical protein
MRIDSASPILPAGSRLEAREVKPVRVAAVAAPTIKDRVETQPKPEVSSTNVLVEMQPGNIVVYKFIDEASGRVIEQIPSEQLLNLSETAHSNEKSTKQK